VENVQLPKPFILRSTSNRFSYARSEILILLEILAGGTTQHPKGLASFGSFMFVPFALFMSSGNG
jgi:hypothetical protein